MWYGRSKILIIHQFSGVWGPISWNPPNCHQIILCIISCNQKMLVWFFIAFWISNNKWGMMKLKCCQFIQFLRGVGTNLMISMFSPQIRYFTISLYWENIEGSFRTILNLYNEWSTMKVNFWKLAHLWGSGN